ncbi:MAG: glutaredoxin domain-containing protein [Rhodanobacter sp.]
MDVNDRIRNTLAEHSIVLFMKGTPQLPMDGCSHRAVGALVSAGADFHGVNVLADPEVRAVLPQFSNFTTFPQLFIRGALIGGCDIIEDLQRAGELARMARDVAGPAP